MFLTLGTKPLVGLFLQAGTKAYEIAISGLPLFAYSAIFFAMNVVPTRHVARRSYYRMHDAGCDIINK